MKLVRKMVYKLKKLLVKKVIVNKYYFEQSYLVFNLKLINFLRIKKIEVYLESEQEVYSVPFDLSKRILTIKMPHSLVSGIKKRANLIVSINNQKVWITPSQQFNALKKDMIIEDSYYHTYINKDIIINNRFNEHKFSQESVAINVERTGYEQVICSVKDDALHHSSNRHIQCFAIQGNKIQAIKTTYHREQKELVLENFELFSTGLWKLFIKINGYLHPIEIYNDKLIEFETYNHTVEIISDHLNFYFKFNWRSLDCEKIIINKKSDNHLELVLDGVAEAAAHSYFQLLVRDVTTDSEYILPIEVSDNQLVTYLDVEHLLRSFSRKSFFVELKGENPKRFQFNLNNTTLLGNSLEFPHNCNSEIVTMRFYKRKDKSLGLNIRRPKVVKYIDKIKDFTIKGCLEPLEGFVNSTAYLCLEERDTQIRDELPIEGDFKINLLDYDLLNIQQKGKTILDFFIIIKNEKKEMIRKEKIKYVHADYRKDNFYGHKVIEDTAGNEHHFLITTTPFKNMKIETFTVPSYIEIPEEVETKDENTWLIGERYNTAQDNGIVFFEWLQKNTDIDAYYVIESDADDYEKIKDHPNVVAFGSKEHFDIALKAKVLLGTHDLENLLPYKSSPGFYFYENTFKVFLQHGVLGRKSVEYNKRFYEDPFDLVIVSSDPEKNEIVVNNWGYEEDEVAVTGLARFDKLIQQEKPKDILLMPTWRDWINTQERFLASKYYAMYSSLIKNPRLLGLLEEHDVNLNFYPHYRAQNFFDKDAEEIAQIGGRVNFIPFGSKTVQQLLIDHALLITDYSSVSFDFILMKKPVIHYHFDVNRFFKHGILRPIEDTFIGQIANREEELINMIEDRINYNFENYHVDISNVIKYQDHNNCERIYKAVKAKLNKLD